jgi:hypothetical protein
MIVGALIKRPCPKCGRIGLRQKRACCVERRRGVKAIIKCQRCGYREAVK